MVTALGSTRLFDTPGYSATRSVAHTLARAGYRVLRFELPPAQIDQTVAEYLGFVLAIADGQTREQLVERHPRRVPFFNAAGRIMDDRTLEFWREQLTLNLADTYSQVKAPVLILWGESDFLTQRACHERIRDVLRAAGNPGVELRTIAGLDHAFARAATPAESHAHYQTGGFVENPAAARAMVEWLGTHVHPER